jgi:hypothetical protein
MREKSKNKALARGVSEGLAEFSISSTASSSCLFLIIKNLLPEDLGLREKSPKKERKRRTKQ